MIALWLSLALAAEHRVVREGDTVESIAAELGDPGLAAALRSRNGLPGDDQPTVGAILWVPDGLPGHVDQPAIVLAVRGSVRATLPGEPESKVEKGQELPHGTTVCTGKTGTLTLRLAAAGVGDTHDDLTLFPGTCLRVDAASARGTHRFSLVSLDEGSISVRQAENPDGAVTIRTASGVTSGGSGGFRVHIEPEAMRTEALDAAASVFGAEQELVLDAGYGSRVREGEAPSDPVKLLLPGSPTGPDDGAALKRPDFTWTPVPRALGYQVQIAAAPDFSDLLTLDSVEGPPEWLPDRLFLPYRVPGLWWRVASVDRTGFMGRWSEPRSLVLPNGLGP